MILVSLSLLSIWGRGEVAKPERLGYSRYDFLTRDNEAHAPGEGDGYHTTTELRRVIQREYDDFARSSEDQSKWQRYQDSRRMFEAMTDAGVDAVDYLPDELAEIDDLLRPRVTELLTLSYDMRNGGRIDQTVIDRCKLRYDNKLTDGSITARAHEKALAQIAEVADFLGLVA